ncbi:hypothetical protein Nepgr_009100 [Nepenthes gracilis]|uniref:Uncharacterized protein n=1 Tax=Nepenthes gracilis TaxID=150966 RepID=A0AAD3XK22_NEPGR|nr:hypothetical protein Nepgr_009100 [Nepenthes gracilis]
MGASSCKGVSKIKQLSIVYILWPRWCRSWYLDADANGPQQTTHGLTSTANRNELGSLGVKLVSFGYAGQGWWLCEAQWSQ